MLLAVSALWDQGAAVILVGAALAGAVALTAHGSKAGLRLALNATMHTRTQTWVSVAEDVLAIGFAVCALFFPLPTLAVTTAMVALSILVGPRLWRAFYLGLRSLAAWLRSIFEPSSWREADRLPGYVRAALGEEPMGSAPHRGVRAALLHVPGIGSFRNGWLVVTAHGPVFVFRSVRGTRVAELPPPRNVQAEPGVWAHRLYIRADHDSEYTIFMLKDGPDMEVASETLSHATP